MRSIMAVPSIEQQINRYLEQLNTRQKRAILTIAKTFAKDQEEAGYSEAFKRELDRRHADYQDGGKLVSEGEAGKRIKKLLKAGKRK